MNRREFLAAVPAALSAPGVASAASAPRAAPVEPYPWPCAAELQSLASGYAAENEASAARPLFRHFAVRNHTDSLVIPHRRSDRAGFTEIRGVTHTDLSDTELDAMLSRRPDGAAAADSTLQGQRGRDGYPLPADAELDARCPFPPMVPAGPEGFRHEELFGCYGEFMAFTPHELDPAQMAGRPAALREKLRHLVLRRYDRIEWACWKLLAGCPDLKHPAGVRVVAPSPRWDKPTAHPLGSRPFFEANSTHGVVFDGRATAYMNDTTADHFCRRLGLPSTPGEMFGTVTSGWGAWAEFRRRQQAFMDAATKDWGGPRFVRFGQGYVAAQPDRKPGSVDKYHICPFIPDGRVIVFGHRTEPCPVSGVGPVGEYLYFRNANNPSLAAGPYTRVIDWDHLRLGPNGPEVHDGHNGIPNICRPRDVLVLEVLAEL